MDGTPTVSNNYISNLTQFHVIIHPTNHPQIILVAYHPHLCDHHPLNFSNTVDNEAKYQRSAILMPTETKDTTMKAESSILKLPECWD